jgi:hypothetical protein
MDCLTIRTPGGRGDSSRRSRGVRTCGPRRGRRTRRSRDRIITPPPSRMNRIVPLACDGQPAGHHVIASTRRSRGSVKPVSREADEAKRSGSTEPWIAGQSRVVMAASPPGRSARVPTGRTRGLGYRQEVTARDAVAGGDSVRVRVHLYERAFPAKPVRRCDGWNEPRAQLTSKGRRTRQCPRHGAVSPDGRDMHVGRERPPAGRAWGEEGGSQMGVAHAHWPLCSAATAAPTRDRRHRAPPAADGKPQTGQKIERP